MDFCLDDIPGHASLLKRLGWSSSQRWYDTWMARGGSGLAASAWPCEVADDWLWGVAFPLLTAVEAATRQPERQLMALSGLPGCGKTSLANWIQAAAVDLDLSVAVISLDDFYWPAEVMAQAMEGNPWNVPRALPGSHDLSLIAESLSHWRRAGVLQAPRFDKALRNGAGDRSGWTHHQADVLVFEGWFLGASSEADSASDPALTHAEQSYRQQVMVAVKLYEPLWTCFDQLWHLRAPAVTASRLWKVQQETRMFEFTGVRLGTVALNNFIRMIETALPQEALQSIGHADVVIELTDDRAVRELR